MQLFIVVIAAPMLPNAKDGRLWAERHHVIVVCANVGAQKIHASIRISAPFEFGQSMHPMSNLKMSGFPFLNLPQTLSTITLGTKVMVRSDSVSEPHATFSALRQIKLSSLATRSPQSRRTLAFNYSIARQRSVHIHPCGMESKSECEGSGTKNSTVYRNKHGEEIVFSKNNPPPGYVLPWTPLKAPFRSNAIRVTVMSRSIV